MTPKITPTAKVRIGEKRESKKGNQYPAAIDHFVCPGILDGKPSTIRIRLVHATVEEAFSNGLEWWVKTAKMTRGALACYTKDGSSDPTAQRMEAYMTPDAEKRSEAKVGTDRFLIKCPARQCPILKRGDCKPMGRLVFTLDGRREVLQIDTKSWNSIELIEGALREAQKYGPLNAPDRAFDLTVRIEKKGGDTFPVMSLQEVAVNVGTEAGTAKADALVAINNGRAAGLEPRVILANALDFMLPGWREREDVIARIQEQGAAPSLDEMEKRLMADES
jgi:hypothetical protein